jgi:hypothetical protein
MPTKQETQEMFGVGDAKYRARKQREGYTRAVQFGPRTHRCFRSETKV